ncbi:hypothetical protein VPH35_057331 [Triticum aestivum]
MASSASLLHASTLAPASSRPLPRRGLAPPQLGLRSSPRRPRGVSLTVAAAASPDVEKAPSSSPPAPSDEPSDLSAVAESVKVLKDAAKTRKVPAPEVLAALAKIKKAKLDTSSFFETLGGTESPGRTWMLIFTAQVWKHLHFKKQWQFSSKWWLIDRFEEISRRVVSSRKAATSR